MATFVRIGSSVMETKSCRNECGEAWCCSYWLNVTDLDACSDYDAVGDNIELALLRGAVVYYEDRYRYLYILIPAICHYLSNDQCRIYDQPCKPKACGRFPVNPDMIPLPSVCPYSKLTTEMLTRVTDRSQIKTITDKFYISA